MNKLKTFCAVLFLCVLSSACVKSLDNVKQSDETPNQVFLVTGDSRVGDFNRENQITEAVIQKSVNYTLVRYGQLDGVLLTGDYVGSGRFDDDWVQWIESMSFAWDYWKGPCIGNHDDQPTHCDFIPNEYLCYLAKIRETNYYKTFGRLDWWSEDKGDVHFISLSSNFDREPLIDAAQKEWLRLDLESNTKKWIIVLFHAPAYASYTWVKKGHGSDMYMRTDYVPILEEYGVDLIINGHNHWVEVTYPILAGERNDENGIRHITIGGGGAPLLPVSPFKGDKVRSDSGDILSEFNRARFHFGVLRVDNDAGVLKFEIIQFINHKVLYETEIRNR